MSIGSRTRRAFLAGAATVAALGSSALTTACGKPRTVRDASHGGVDFKELVPKNPDDSLPIVVAIHGLGGAPEHWVDGWMKLAGNATIVLPRGFDKHEGGFSWFPWEDAKLTADNDMKSAALAERVAAAEERLWKGIAALGRRRVVVAGYTQGAILSYVMAARRADVVIAAFPVVGACPASLRPNGKQPHAPVVAYHGTADEVVPIAAARESIAAFQAQGGSRLREYPGVRHTATDAMHADLDADMHPVVTAKG